MTDPNILKTLEIISKFPDKLQNLLDAIDVLTEDARFMAYSHQTFLPIARKYITNKSTANYQIKNARVRRAQLGGASKWLYYHQKRTFEKTIKLLFPVPMPQQLIDRVWQQVRLSESRMLHIARAHYGNNFI